MNMARVWLICIVPLLWCVNEILTIKVYEAMSDGKNFTIDASPSGPDPTAPAATQSINLFLPESSQMPTRETEHANKTKKTHHFPGQVERILKPVDEMKKQSWQIPSPLSPLATSDPKMTNSSKRQTDFVGEFVPSQQVGFYDNTQAFVPHSLHEPKSVPLKLTYSLPKPVKHDEDVNGYGYSGEPRLPPGAAKGLQSFEHDFEGLKAKYPELNHLVNDYPIMEEIMKQKLAEKFQQSYYNRHHLDDQSGERFKGKFESSNEQREEYDVTIKVNSHENGKDFNQPTSQEKPYQFESGRTKWEQKLPDISSTPGASYIVPAGEFYKEPKFPITEYFDDKNHTHYELKPLKPKKAVSPWKKVLHLVTALLPVGLLLTALTPNVITISNVADKNYPIRQRSTDDGSAVINFLNSNLKEGEESGECEERRFCEMAISGKDQAATMIEKIFWTLAQSTPKHVAEMAGVRKLFEAVQEGRCSSFECHQKHKEDKKAAKKKAVGEHQGRYKRIEKSHFIY